MPENIYKRIGWALFATALVGLVGESLRWLVGELIQTAPLLGVGMLLGIQASMCLFFWHVYGWRQAARSRKPSEAETAAGG